MLSMIDKHRPKQPDLVRAEVIRVVLDLLVEEGIQAITLDAVAQKAGVSKGGLQYHFRSKHALLEAVSDELLADFLQQFNAALAQEEEGPACHARAYVRTCFQVGSSPEEVRQQRAIGVLALNWPPCRERWSQMMDAALQDEADDSANADRLLLARLAGDGFWFARMLDVYPIDPARQAALCNAVLALCEAG